MIVEKITTHVHDGLGRLLEQYKNRPRLIGMHTAFFDQIQDLEDAIFDLDTGRQVWNGESSPAIGVTLDNIGTLVGIERNGLADDEYLLFLFGKIAENFSDTTLGIVLSVTQYMFQPSVIVVDELPPAGLCVQAFGVHITENLFPIAKKLIKQSLGAGIELVFSSAAPNTNVFRFAGSTSTGEANGFADPDDPLSGGRFVGTI